MKVELCRYAAEAGMLGGGGLCLFTDSGVKVEFVVPFGVRVPINRS